jgi:formylglycine-generating enzyme
MTKRRWRAAARALLGVLGLVACGRVDLGSFGDGALGGASGAGAASGLAGSGAGGSPSLPLPAEPGAGNGGTAGSAALGIGGAGSLEPPITGDAGGALPSRDAAVAGGACQQTCAGERGCCAFDFVPMGTFERGGLADPVERPASTNSFYLDTFEVTVGRFREFAADYDRWRAAGNPRVGAAGYDPVLESGWQERWNNALPPSADALRATVERCYTIPYSTVRYAAQNPLEPGVERLPLNCVSWFEAFAFCAWDGGRLPTELEWEFAAAGSDENRRYPWGDDEVTTEHVEYACGFDADRFDAGSVVIDAGAGEEPISYPQCEMDDFPQVGSRPAGTGRWGQRDLAGSLHEWVLDTGALYPTGGCFNCVSLEDERTRMFRGGSWFDPSVVHFAVHERNGMDPAGRLHMLGVRCARSGARGS